MARYTSSLYGRGRKWHRRWISIISVIVVGALAVVFVLGYNPFSNKQKKQDIKAPEIARESVKPEETKKKVEPAVKPEPPPAPPKPAPEVNLPRVPEKVAVDPNSEAAK
ncbi:MAG: hypothetical protein ACYSSI_10760, partial [Planctomycetota bacterium]